MTGTASDIKTWLILGGSSSVARAFARHAAAAGANILLAGRDTKELKTTVKDVIIRHNVSAEALHFNAEESGNHDELARHIDATSGHIGIFLLFGTMPEQAEIDNDFDLAKRTIEVNYLGAVSILSRLVPRLERDRAGCIIVMGSVAGDRGRLKNYVYGSAKAGLHTYLQGLRARLSRFGVSVTTVKAGFIDTDMSFGAPGLFLVASPDMCAAACLSFANTGRDVVYFPWFWRYIMLIIRHIPERVFKRMNI
ncbi:MAG: SDR family NAD(P)-dependent oxidoreductase [Pseudomonadota bacterium]|nr:SDR family NAD(P)-dependent oxidoreductase [Pseudomonadota bacterium]